MLKKTPFQFTDIRVLTIRLTGVQLNIFEYSIREFLLFRNMRHAVVAREAINDKCLIDQTRFECVKKLPTGNVGIGLFFFFLTVIKLINIAPRYPVHILSIIILPPVLKIRLPLNTRISYIPLLRTSYTPLSSSTLFPLFFFLLSIMTLIDRIAAYTQFTTGRKPTAMANTDRNLTKEYKFINLKKTKYTQLKNRYSANFRCFCFFRYSLAIDDDFPNRCNGGDRVVYIFVFWKQ